jgi:hypothetical protein
MATNKTTVSVYADEDLLAALNEFKDSGNHKSLNVAIVAILREKLFGEASGNIQSTLQSKVSSALDIESMVETAIAAKLSEIKDEIKEEYGAGFRGVSANITDLMQQRDREIDELKADIQSLREATAPAKKLKIVA